MADFTDNKEYMIKYNKWYAEFALLFKSKRVLFNPFGLVKDIDNKIDEAIALNLFTKEDGEALKAKYRADFRTQFKKAKDKFKK